jgi:hypothetical protein
MVHSTFQRDFNTTPPPHSHTLSVYTVHWEGGSRSLREGTVEGQQYTSTL